MKKKIGNLFISEFSFIMRCFEKIIINLSLKNFYFSIRDITLREYY